jgi:glycosyltransferase involved in cell wall biosynthesis
MAKAILVANTDWYLYNFRLALARHLRDQGWEVVLISPAGRFAPLLQQAGFRWLEWNVGRQTLAPWTELNAAWRLLRLYQREGAALVHHFTIKPVLYGTLAARFLRIPVIVNSITGLGYVFLGQDLKARLLRRLVTLIYRLVFASPRCAAIFENDSDRRYFIEQGLIDAERTWLIEGVGIDVNYFTPLPEPDNGGEAGKPPVVVLPARMLWDKGVGTLVEAARQLKPRLTARFVLVGEPDPGNPASIEVETLRDWVDQGLVEWWGWQQDMRAVYSQSHIVTLPSFGEGVPTVLLEAAACARPIVTTNTPGCRDVVRDGVNGLTVQPNDPTALAEALERLITDPALRGRMGAAGRAFALDRYTSERINNATLAVYNSLPSSPAS